jgi:hypothetical protein
MFSDWVFPVPRGERIGLFSNYLFWTIAISLRAVAHKLQWLHSFPRGFGGPEGFLHFPLSIFYEKDV